MVGEICDEIRDTHISLLEARGFEDVGPKQGAWRHIGWQQLGISFSVGLRMRHVGSECELIRDLMIPPRQELARILRHKRVRRRSSKIERSIATLFV